MTDDQTLSDFGGGSDPDPNPEDEVKLRLSRWLDQHGAKVYWERDKRYGYSTFSTSTRKKPDLVVEGDQRTYVIEVKHGDESSEIHDGALQTVNYWETIANNDVTYKVNGKSIEPDAVLLATDYAPLGKLFNTEGTKDRRRTEYSEGRQRAVSWGALPKDEYGATETLIRMMWRFSKDRTQPEDLGIGGLFSSHLDRKDDGGYDVSKPVALFKYHRSDKPQQWEYIPWYLDK